MLIASCNAMLVTNLPAWPTSPPPREKKKLAPRRCCSEYVRATVRAMVDFPVPAKPFNQKMHRSSCLTAQLYMSRRSSTRVSWRQVGSCRRWYELKGASTAYGSRLNRSHDGLVHATGSCTLITPYRSSCNAHNSTNFEQISIKNR